MRTSRRRPARRRARPRAESRPGLTGSAAPPRLDPRRPRLELDARRPAHAPSVARATRPRGSRGLTRPASPRPHKYRIGLTVSAAAVGVGARRSAAKSASVKSTSWPTPQTTGTAQARTARTTAGGVAGSALPRFAGAAGNHKTARHKSGLEPGYTSVATPSAGTQRVGWGAGKLAPPAGARTLDLAQHAMVWSMHTLRRSSAAWPRQDQVHQDRTLCIPVQESGGS